MSKNYFILRLLLSMSFALKCPFLHICVFLYILFTTLLKTVIFENQKLDKNARHTHVTKIKQYPQKIDDVSELEF